MERPEFEEDPKPISGYEAYLRGYHLVRGRGIFALERLERTLEQAPLDGLSDEDRKEKLSDCTLGQFAKLFERFDEHDLMIKDFFNDIQYTKINNTQFSYDNNIIQFTMADFFESKGYNLIFETTSEYSTEQDPQKSSIKISLTEEFDIYTDAILFFVNEDTGSKFCLELIYDPNRMATEYTIRNDDKSKTLWKEWEEYAKEHNFYKGQKIDAIGEFLDVDDISWDDVIITDKVRTTIRRNIENMFKYEKILKQNNVKVKRGVILAGEPGTGKTLVCKALIRDSESSVLYVLPSHISRINDVGRICRMAKELGPTLLIIEDIDWFAEQRDYGAMGSTGITVELMNKMDGIEDFGDVITLATTNCPDKIEEAIKNRPGRFDRVIQIGLPTIECRKKMLNQFTKDYIIDDDVDFDSLAKKECNKMTGAYISTLCSTAAVCAVEADSLTENGQIILKNEHFETSYNEIKDKDFTQLGKKTGDDRMGFT